MTAVEARLGEQSRTSSLHRMSTLLSYDYFVISAGCVIHI